MFLKVSRRKGADGGEILYASVVENRRVGGKTVQTQLINIGRVTEDQVPYLKAAWSERKPRLVWDEGEPAEGDAGPAWDGEPAEGEE